MKKVVLSGLFTFATAFVLQAQDLEQAKKAIDAEKFSEARKTLKGLVNTQADKGANYFYLGQVYLKLEKNDSARIYFEKGLKAKDAAFLNNIGLGHLSLINGNKSGAQANFATALQVAGKKAAEAQIFISRAYMNADNPDFSKAVEAAKAAVAADGKSALAKLTLGDAQYGNKNSNDAYGAYREAFELDKTLFKAKLQLAVITRNAQAFPEAVKAINEVVALNAGYGPAYRELAETNLAWAFARGSNFQEKVKEALTYYKKYMSLTDSSVDSRLKYADFLILTKDWKGLETEAKAIQQMDKNNAKVLRYLGFAAFENGNNTAAVSALNELVTNPRGTKLIGRDYFYLGKAKYATALDANGVLANKNVFADALVSLSKASDMDLKLADDFSEIGVKLYKSKAYLEAAKVLELALKNSASKTYVTDNYYYGNAIFYHSANLKAEEKAKLSSEFAKANEALATVIKVSPSTQDAYLSKGKLNRVIDTDVSKKQAVVDYEGYVTAVTNKGVAELGKDSVKKNLFEAYSFIGSGYASVDKVKAITAFEKALELNPTDAYVKGSLSVLKK